MTPTPQTGTEMAGNKLELAEVQQTENMTSQRHNAMYDYDDNTVVDLAAGKSDPELAGNLKVSSDGHTVLVPQPSDDPNDPLNWPWTKKNLILLVICTSAFLADFQAGAGTPCVKLQGKEWGISANRINFTGNLNILMVGLGGVFWIPFIYYWGRVPVLFWTTLAGTLFTLGCCLTNSFHVYYAMRALMGFTFTAGQTVGLAFIQDMFFFHEHARKIGFWAWIHLMAPYSTPLLGNFIISGTENWRLVFWVVFALAAWHLLLVVLFIDETWYRRDILQEQQPSRGGRVNRLLGIWQVKNHHGYFLTLRVACLRVTRILIKPVILPIMFYYMCTFMWATGINHTTSLIFTTPIKTGGYGFSARSLGYIYFAPLIAVCLGELFGHFFNDFLAHRYIKSHAGRFKPETRLWSNYIAAIIMIPGITLFGQSLGHQLPWPALAFGWGMYLFGAMVASVSTTAYALDSYPSSPGEVAGFINLARVMGGFSVGYFQLPWGKAVGYAAAFGTQAGIISFAVGVLIIIQIFGQRLRKWGGAVEV